MGMRPLVILLSLTSLSAAKEVARWEPGRSDGVGVTHEAVNDYYRRSAHVVTIDRPLTAPVWLAAGYLDKGYAHITITPGVPMVDQHGVARLNTGRVRQAVFRLTRPAASLRIEGLGELRSISITDAQPVLEPLPQAKPALEFAVPSQRVTTAGAEVGTAEQRAESLATMRQLLPLAKAVGFNAI